jgi:hypothetical protein
MSEQSGEYVELIFNGAGSTGSSSTNFEFTPSGDNVSLVFSGQTPPLQEGSDLIFAFNINGTIVTSNVQSVLAFGVLGGGLFGAGQTGQGEQKIEATGSALLGIIGIESKTRQASQTAEILGIYRPPNANNLIIDLGTGAYAPPSGNNVIIDLGDLLSTAEYTEFMFHLAETSFF